MLLRKFQSDRGLLLGKSPAGMTDILAMRTNSGMKDGMSSKEAAYLAEQARYKFIAERYLDQTPGVRDKMLVVDPSREGRDALNKWIRAGLAKRGELTGTEAKVEALESRRLTDQETRLAGSYQSGDIVRFGSTVRQRRRSIGDLGTRSARRRARDLRAEGT